MDAPLPPRLDAGRADAGTWMGWPACDPSATSQRLTFVHVNDLHAHYGVLGPDRISPWARVRHVYERTRLESPYTIFTDGGDDHEKGSVAEQLSEGRSTHDAVIAMQFDVRVIGNHDFAWSLESVLEHSVDPHAVVLSANHHFRGPDPSRWQAEEFHVLEVGCLRVGFVGLTSTPWDERDQPVAIPFYDGFDASYDYPAEARRVLAAHAGEADVIVFVDHIGQGDDEALAAAVPEIDVILSGHSHTFTPAPVSAGGAVVVQSGSAASFVVRLDVDVDLATHAVTVADYTTHVAGLEPPSDELQGEIASILARDAPEAERVIGQMEERREGASVADVAARAVIAQHGADVALIDADTVWSAWRAGDLTQEACHSAFLVEREPPASPGFSALYRVRVRGDRLATLLAFADAHSDRWRHAGLATPDASTIYELVLQKRAAFHPDEQLDPSIVFEGPPEAIEETWRTIGAYARARTAACLHVDTNTPIDGCTP
jgi:hypothetical protein